MSDTPANRLSQERSSYLKSAAHQPIHWYPWSEEAFQKAKELNRPILLDIGAVWCHWCHVMDGESYEDPEIAQIINEHFIAVKVDRDERPDLDSRYQIAVSAITGQGGWPLTAFLTPEGQVFFGGTYFPPDNKYGRPGFKSVLAQVRDYYYANLDKVRSSAEGLYRELARHAVEMHGGRIGWDRNEGKTTFPPRSLLHRETGPRCDRGTDVGKNGKGRGLRSDRRRLPSLLNG